MTCPRNEFGQRPCDIVDHPDRPYESFCTVCHQRFEKKESEMRVQTPAIMVIMALALSILILNSLTPPVTPPSPNTSPSQAFQKASCAGSSTDITLS